MASANVAQDNKDKNTAKTDNVTNVTTEAAKPEVVKTADTGSQLNSDSNKHKDLNAPDDFQKFVDNLVKTSQNVKAEFSGELAQVTNLREIANQIVDRIKVSVTPDQSSMELQLNPENLGKVNLSIQSKQGIMTAHFVVQNEISKEAIESQIQTLRDTLHQQGIKVEAIEVTVSSNAFDQNSSKGSDNPTESNDSHSGRKITLDDAVNMTEIPEEENSQEDITGVRGSMVDYTA